MGDLIVMSRANPLPPREIVAGSSAEILFFTGVRYYRMDEVAETPVSVGRSVIKRRRSPEQRRAAKRLRVQKIEALA